MHVRERGVHESVSSKLCYCSIHGKRPSVLDNARLLQQAKSCEVNDFAQFSA